MKSLSRCFISDIQPQSQVRQVFRVLDKQHRANRQGNMYLLLQLSDKTGVISGIRWNSDQRLYDSFQKGDFLNVSGAAQLHNGIMQIIVNDFDWIDASQINLDDFEVNNPEQIDKTWSELQTMMGSLEDPDLAAIAEMVFSTPSIADRLKIAPAGIKTHHAYPGGLAHHIHDLLLLSDFVASQYPSLHRDILLLGVLLHDIGKIEELQYGDELGYSDAGQLLGHLVQGIEILSHLVQAVESKTQRTLNPEYVLRLKHIIASHHGTLEHGSPKVPMTLEAIVFSHLDDMDAKLNAATEMIRGDRNTDSPWTAFQPTLGRKVFKPSMQD